MVRVPQNLNKSITNPTPKKAKRCAERCAKKYPYPKSLLVTSSEGRWACLTSNFSYDHCRRITPWADKPTTLRIRRCRLPHPREGDPHLVSLTSQSPSFCRTASGVAGPEFPVEPGGILLPNTLQSPSVQVPVSSPSSCWARALRG